MPKESRPVYMNDKWFYRGVVAFLDIAVILFIAGCIWLSKDGSISNALVAIGSGTLGALAGLFK